MARPGPPTWNDLPDEISAHIFSYLPPGDLRRAAQVSHAWRRVADDSDVWRMRVLGLFPSPPQQEIDHRLTWKETYRLLQNGKAHPRQCIMCAALPISGVAYRCFHCRNFWMCECCFASTNGRHEEGHLFVKIRHPKAAIASQLYFQFPRSPLRTHQVTCNGCHTKPIVGTRYKCLACSDFSLCERCYASGTYARAPLIGTKRSNGTDHKGPHVFAEVLFQESRHTEHNSPTWCDGCTRPITATRFKCLNCFNYDLCAECEENERHRFGEKHCLLMLRDGASLCCYNLQYAAWTERSPANEAIMAMQRIIPNAN